MMNVYLGLSYSGLAQGISDLREQWLDEPEKANIRWTVDLLYYVVIIVMLLNIVFGIVIDTFAQQRDLQSQIKENMENVRAGRLLSAGALRQPHLFQAASSCLMQYYPLSACPRLQLTLRLSGRPGAGPLLAGVLHLWHRPQHL